MHPVWDATPKRTMSGSLSFCFNPRIPCGMRQGQAREDKRRHKFQSTHPVSDATLKVWPKADFIPVSIHAPRVGCDRFPLPGMRRRHRFNPRTPCGMRRLIPSLPSTCTLFQSTHPVWDATQPSRWAGFTVRSFNPRIPCGMRRRAMLLACRTTMFQSTHPVWDATWEPTPSSNGYGFQSTHPVWDATCTRRHGATLHFVSIHASRVGCDCKAKTSH